MRARRWRGGRWSGRRGRRRQVHSRLHLRLLALNLRYTRSVHAFSSRLPFTGVYLVVGVEGEGIGALVVLEGGATFSNPGVRDRRTTGAREVMQARLDRAAAGGLEWRRSGGDGSEGGAGGTASSTAPSCLRI